MPLTALGISPRASAVYDALTREPALRRDELGARLVLTTDDVVDALTELSDHELIRRPGPGCAADPGWEVVRPSLALNRLIERREDDLLRQLRIISALRSQVSQLDQRFNLARSDEVVPHKGIERVTGLDAIRERIEELTFFTRTSVLSVQPGGPQSPESLEASRPLDRRMSRRNVSIRLIHSASVLDDELNRIYLHELLELGAEIRVTEQPVDRLLILDGEVAVVPVDPANSRAGALVVREPALLAGLVDLFERIWAASELLHWQAGGPIADTGTVSVEDRDVLAMLATGSTDETIARAMGISVRHLRRTISRLMSELGAHSRFEAGAQGPPTRLAGRRARVIAGS